MPYSIMPNNKSQVIYDIQKRAYRQQISHIIPQLAMTHHSNYFISAVNKYHNVYKPAMIMAGNTFVDATRQQWFNTLIQVIQEPNDWHIALNTLISPLPKKERSILLTMQDQHGDTLLHHAIFCQQLYSLQCLLSFLRHSTVFAIKNAMGETPITLAQRISNNRIEYLNAIMTCPYNLTSPQYTMTKKGPCLFYQPSSALFCNPKEEVKKTPFIAPKPILKKDIHHDGLQTSITLCSTLLEDAVSEGHINMVKALLRFADEKKLLSALHIAKEKELTEIFQLITYYYDMTYQRNPSHR